MTELLWGHPSNDAAMSDAPKHYGRSGMIEGMRLHTNYYCDQCGGVVSSGIKHVCSPVEPRYIADDIENEMRPTDETEADGDR